MAAAVSLSPHVGRYAWDLNGYLRAGGKLSKVLEAFQDEYTVITMHDRQTKAEKKKAAAAAVPVSATGTYCKVR